MGKEKQFPISLKTIIKDYEKDINKLEERRIKIEKSLIANKEVKLCCVEDCIKSVKKNDKYCSMHRARITRTNRLDKMLPLERIMAKIVKKKNGCWEWQGYKNKDGYGRCRANVRKVLVHRYVYEQLIAPIPTNRITCHFCDNPAYVNPKHIFIGTHKDNVRDCINKGRFRGWENSPWI